MAEQARCPDDADGVGHDKVRGVYRVAVALVARAQRSHLRAECDDMRGPAFSYPTADEIGRSAGIERVHPATENRQRATGQWFMQ